MKQFETRERQLGDNTFYIRPFPAFKASNISGELFSVILPMLGSLAPMATSAMKGDADNLLDKEIDFDVAGPALVRGLASLSGDKLEMLLKKLLVKHQNVSVQIGESENVKPLTEDLANELFCGDTQDMFILAVEVIQANYLGFFKRLGGLFGDHISAFRSLVQKTPPGPKSTEN